MHGHWLKGYLREGKEIEGGGSGGEGALIVSLDADRRANRTFGEIADALAAGRPVYIADANYYLPVFFVSLTPGDVTLTAFNYDLKDSMPSLYDASNTRDSYPRFNDDK